MDTQDPPNRPHYQLTRGLIGLDNKKDAMTSRCLDRKEVRHATWRTHTGTGPLVGALSAHIRRLFLSFGGPVCADRISNCPLDRVLTYKNLIYLLNLQFHSIFCKFSSISLSKTISSAYRSKDTQKSFILTPSFNIFSVTAKSFRYILNKTGDRLSPCPTPESVTNQFVNSLFIRTAETVLV